MITIFSINMFDDALRYLLNPRLRGDQGSFGAAKKRKRGFFANSPSNQKCRVEQAGLSTKKMGTGAHPTILLSTK